MYQLGLIFSNLSLYGPSHVIVQRALLPCYDQLCEVFKSQETLEVSIIRDELLIDGKKTDSSRSRAFIKKFDELPIKGFRLTRGMSVDEFGLFLDLVNEGASLGGAGGIGGTEAFMERVAASGMKHFAPRNIVYKAVEADSEEAQEGDDGDAPPLTSPVAVPGGGTDTGSPPVADAAPTTTDAAENNGGAEPTGPAEPEAEDHARIEKIVAFLRGNPEVDRAEVSDQLQDASLDIGQLGDLIVRSAVVAQRQADLSGGESLSDIVVGCLRRLTDELKRDKKHHTAKGAKSAARTLALLERDILEQLRELAGGEADEALERVQLAFEEASAELEVESLAAQVDKKQEALARSQQDLLKGLKKHGKQDLASPDTRALLEAAGLSGDSWQQLVLSSDNDLAGGGPALSSTEGVLTTMLARLVQVVESRAGMGGVPAEQGIGDTVAQLGRELERVAAQAGERVAELEAVDATAGSEAAATSRRQLARLVGEVLSHWNESLSAMAMATDILGKGHVGALNPAQAELVDLIDTTGKKLLALSKRLEHALEQPPPDGRAS